MEESSRSPGCCPRLPKRYIVLLLVTYCSGFSIAAASIYHTGLFVASPRSVQESEIDPDVCNSTTKRSENTSHIMLFHWKKDAEKSMRDASFGSPLPTSLIVGIFADTHNPKYIILGISAGQILLYITYPVIIENCGDQWKFILIWIIVSGLVEGGLTPTIMAILGQWIPSEERAFMVCIFHAGRHIGWLVGELTVRLLIKDLHQLFTTMYVMGGMGVIWCLVWYLCFFHTPQLHPTITEKEKLYLRQDLGPYINYRVKKIPWFKILKSLPLWAFMLSSCGVTCAEHVLFKRVSVYLSEFIKADMKTDIVMVMVVPVLTLVVTDIAAGYIGDFLIRRDIMEATTMTKFYTSFGAMGVGIYSLAITYTSCNKQLAMQLHTVATWLMVFFRLSVDINALDIAPNFSGTLCAISYTAGEVIIGTTIFTMRNEERTGYILNYWRTLFWGALGVYSFTTIFFSLFGSSHTQSWNAPQRARKTTKPSNMVHKQSTLFAKQSSVFADGSDIYYSRRSYI